MLPFAYPDESPIAASSHYGFGIIGEPVGIRTRDLLIKSFKSYVSVPCRASPVRPGQASAPLRRGFFMSAVRPGTSRRWPPAAVRMDVAILVSPAGCYNENTSGALVTETDLTDQGCAMPNDRTFRVIPIASVLALALMVRRPLRGPS
jgi:hypothetical protein